MLTEIGLQHRGRMYHSQRGGSSDGVVCGSVRQNLYTILSGQIRARGLCISAKGTVGKASQEVSTVTNAGNKGSPSEAGADSARMLSPVLAKLEARLIAVVGQLQGQRAC
jgi:hypothetical protein